MGDACAALIAGGLMPTRIAGDHIQFTAPGARTYTLKGPNKAQAKLDPAVLRHLQSFLKHPQPLQARDMKVSGAKDDPSDTDADPDRFLPATRNRLRKDQALLLNGSIPATFVRVPTDHEDYHLTLIWVKAGEGLGRDLRTITRTSVKDGQCDYLIHLDMVDVRKRPKDFKD
jgi:hypothetical protein